jgi:hypothetical protein
MPLRSTKRWWGVTLDAPDALELARFYARLLDPAGHPFCLYADA